AISAVPQWQCRKSAKGNCMSEGQLVTSSIALSQAGLILRRSSPLLLRGQLLDCGSNQPPSSMEVPELDSTGRTYNYLGPPSRLNRMRQRAFTSFLMDFGN